MDKKKFYINEEGVIEVTPFFDKQVKKNQEYIELTFEEWQEKLSTCTYGFKKVYKDGDIIEVEDENITNSDEYKEISRLTQIQQFKDYLASTDYVISKLNESKIEDEKEYLTLKEKYQETLNKRVEARKRINELGG